MDAGCPWKYHFWNPLRGHLLGTSRLMPWFSVAFQGSTRWWSTSPTPIVCRTFLRASKGCVELRVHWCLTCMVFTVLAQGGHRKRLSWTTQHRETAMQNFDNSGAFLLISCPGCSVIWLKPLVASICERKSSAYNVMGVQVAERKDEHVHERQWSLVSCLLRFYVHIF